VMLKLTLVQASFCSNLRCFQRGKTTNGRDILALFQNSHIGLRPVLAQDRGNVDVERMNRITQRSDCQALPLRQPRIAPRPSEDITPQDYTARNSRMILMLVQQAPQRDVAQLSRRSSWHCTKAVI
jgi:hypothetical protein